MFVFSRSLQREDIFRCKIREPLVYNWRMVGEKGLHGALRTTHAW
jgi:hypothetical protein